MQGGKKMNQEIIGSFIAKCRKEKNLTQLQLAEKLNITNRAVSKWETGKSIPDVSIMPELCEILEISVNELLSGERIGQEDYFMKAEKNFLEMFSNNKGKKKLTIMQVIGEGLFLCGLTFFLSFPHILELSGVEDVIMRGMGVFVMACGFGVTFLAKKIKNELTI